MALSTAKNGRITRGVTPRETAQVNVIIGAASNHGRNAHSAARN
jgi:hypothetical protein